nr:putative ribonuclease H-like domain-containing protein [Tanacetum cinerariifolium]
MANEEEDHALVADHEALTEFALMAKSSSDTEVFDNSLCSKACKKNTDSLNSKITELSKKLSDTKTNLYHYKLGLSQVEARLVEFKNQEIKLCEKIRGLEFKVESKTNRIESLTNELEMLKKKKEGLDSKLKGFQLASKDLDTLLGSQMSNKNKEGLGYNDTITDYSRPSPSRESKSNDLQNNSTSISENGESTSSILSKPEIKFVKAADSPTVIKTNKDETVRKPSVKYAEMYRKTSKSSNVRGNQRNWNNLKSQQLGKNFLMKNKACFNCGDFDHLSYDYVRTQFSIPRVSTVNRKFPTINKKFPTGNSKHSTADLGNKGKAGNSQNVIDDEGYWDSGFSRHMIGNISYLSYYEPYDGGYVSFGQGGCKIIGKGTIKTGKLEFENVYFVKDLKYNQFSVSQICDNKNSVLFTDSKCIVLGRDFKLRDDTNVLLRTPRQHNMYSIDLTDIVPHKDLTCLVTKASADESELWHRRLGHLNFKTMNRLVRHNLVKGLPSKCFDNDHTYVSCLKEKQHKAFCKTKVVNSVTKPLHTLHMDLFGPTSINSLNHKWYCLVVTDDFSRFTWTFLLKTKDETSGILRNFITEIENLKELKVKIIRCENGSEFRNKEINDLCSRKGIKKEFSNVRTPQQNGVAKRRNRTLIEAARTMLADAKLPVTF